MADTNTRRRRRLTAKRVRFVRQWAIETKSDHRALFVHVQIRSRWGGLWRDLLLVSANMGGHFGEADLIKLARAAETYGRQYRTDPIPFLIAFQEAGDQPWLPRSAADLGLRTLTGHRRGEASTPLAASKGIDVLHDQWDEVVGPANVGPGAGPSRSKAKGWRRTRFAVDGVRFGASSFHEYASLGRRFAWALRLAGPVVAAILRMGRPFFLVGDFNADNSQPLIRWLIRRGMTTNHRQLGELATHGRRSIDAVAVQAALVVRGGADRG